MVGDGEADVVDHPSVLLHRAGRACRGRRPGPRPSGGARARRSGRRWRGQPVAVGCRATSRRRLARAGNRAALSSRAIWRSIAASRASGSTTRAAAPAQPRRVELPPWQTSAGLTRRSQPPLARSPPAAGPAALRPNSRRARRWRCRSTRRGPRRRRRPRHAPGRSAQLSVRSAGRGRASARFSASPAAAIRASVEVGAGRERAPAPTAPPRAPHRPPRPPPGAGQAGDEGHVEGVVEGGAVEHPVHDRARAGRKRFCHGVAGRLEASSHDSHSPGAGRRGRGIGGAASVRRRDMCTLDESHSRCHVPRLLLATLLSVLALILACPPPAPQVQPTTAAARPIAVDTRPWPRAKS